MNEDLAGYVKKQLSKGQSPDQIKLRLLQAGYDKNTVFENFSLASRRKDEHLRNAVIIVLVVFLLVASVSLYINQPVKTVGQQSPNISPPSTLVRQASYSVLLGKDAISRGDNDMALEFFGEAEASDPGNSEAHYFLGHLLLQQGNLSGAETELKQAIKIAPKAFKVYSDLGYIYLRQGNYPLSEQMFTESLFIEKNVDAYDGLGWVKIKTKEYQTALRYFNSSSSLSTTTEEPLVGLGYSYFYLQDNSQAKDYLKKALVLNPTNSAALSGLALVYANETDYDRAISIALDAVRFDNSTPDYYLTLAKLFYLTNDYASAKKYMDKYFGFNDLELYQKQAQK